MVPPLLFAPYRLPTKRFPKVFEDAKSEACASMVMRFVPNDEAKTCVGVIAAKRTFRLSVERSRARRLLREAFRLERLQLVNGYDLVLIGRRKLVTMKCQEVRKDLLKLCRRAGLLVAKPSKRANPLP